MNLLHYGLQRSGTNYLETLLGKNYRVRFLNSNRDRRSPLQKHFRLYDDKEIVPEPQYLNDIKIDNFEQFERLFDVVPDYYLVISKDPYSWYLSYRNWARKCNWPDVDHHYISEYNLFYGKFLEFSRQTGKIIFIKYVDLVRDADSVLEQLEKKMSLKKKLLARLKLRRTGRVSQSSRFTDDRRAYYLDENYLEKYSNDELQALNDCLDAEVASLLGYEKRVVAK
jgi:hypothetical protein